MKLIDWKLLFIIYWFCVEGMGSQASNQVMAGQNISGAQQAMFQNQQYGNMPQGLFRIYLITIQVLYNFAHFL